MESSYNQYDLRRMKVGGWEASRLKSKVNGKWVYFYNPDNNELMNCKELIDFEKRYIPPNHKPKKRNVVSRSLEKKDVKNYRAPLQFSQHPRLLAPVVYSSFSSIRVPQHLAKKTRSKTACRTPKTTLISNDELAIGYPKTSHDIVRGNAATLQPIRPVSLNAAEKVEEEKSDFDSQQNSSTEE